MFRSDHYKHDGGCDGTRNETTAPCDDPRSGDAVTITAAESADRFRAEPDRFLDVGAGEVAYRRFGTGPDVLFVHGWPVGQGDFRTLLPHLADDVTCHVIDLPGRDRVGSVWDPTEHRSTHHQRAPRADILELADVAAVVGHDSGGLIARHALAGDARRPCMGFDRHRTAPWAELALPDVPRRTAPAGIRRRPRLDDRSQAAAPQPVRARRRVR